MFCLFLLFWLVLLKLINPLLKDREPPTTGLSNDPLKSRSESIKKLKLSKFGTFSIRQKKSRIGRNPKTKETKVISSRDVVLFKPSKEFKEFVNFKDNG